jgi:rubredoxin
LVNSSSLRKGRVELRIEYESSFREEVEAAKVISGATDIKKDYIIINIYNKLREAGYKYDPSIIDKIGGYLRDVYLELVNRDIIDKKINLSNMRISYTIGGRQVSSRLITAIGAVMESLGVAELDTSFRVATTPELDDYRFFVELACPSCGSGDITKTVLIYHKACGYVGTREEFEKEAIESYSRQKILEKAGKEHAEPRSGSAGGTTELEGLPEYLVCPRCHVKLFEEGRDYEIIGNIYKCNNCNATFKEPVIRFISARSIVGGVSIEKFNTNKLMYVSFPSIYSKRNVIEKMRKYMLVESFYLFRRLSEKLKDYDYNITLKVPFKLSDLFEEHQEGMAEPAFAVGALISSSISRRLGGHGVSKIIIDTQSRWEGLENALQPLINNWTRIVDYLYNMKGSVEKGVEIEGVGFPSIRHMIFVDDPQELERAPYVIEPKISSLIFYSKTRGVGIRTLIVSYSREGEEGNDIDAKVVRSEGSPDIEIDIVDVTRKDYKLWRILDFIVEELLLPGL